MTKFPLEYIGLYTPSSRLRIAKQDNVSDVTSRNLSVRAKREVK